MVVVCEYTLPLATSLAAKHQASAANVMSRNIRLLPFLIMIDKG